MIMEDEEPWGSASEFMDDAEDFVASDCAPEECFWDIVPFDCRDEDRGGIPGTVERSR